jgi:hypothetical protein
MIVKRFSATKVLNTNSSTGFVKGRKYDTDLDRLGRSSTQRELHKEVGNLNFSSELKEAKRKARKELKEAGDINKEIQKNRNELNSGRTGKWLHTE